MLAVQVELLTGKYVASRFNDRNKVEWPPHPARLFSAAVAAFADVDEPYSDEREALLWWEEQGPPSIRCSWEGGEWSERAPVTHFVPVNDTQVVARDLGTSYQRLRTAIDGAREAGTAAVSELARGKAVAKAERGVTKLRAKVVADSAKASSGGSAPTSALGILPDARSRQARLYPTAIPADDRVTYQWPNADTGSSHVGPLDRVLGRIARLGHSSSLVSVTVSESAAIATLEPHEGGSIGLRVASRGQLDALEVAYAAHRAEDPRILPAAVAGYRVSSMLNGRPHESLFGGDWALLELQGRARLTLREVLPLARAVRGALMRHGQQDPVPEVISGHLAGGPGEATSPTDRPHLAVVPLPSAGHRYADGLVRTVALVLPKEIDSHQRALVDSAVRRWLEEEGLLQLGPRGVVKVAPIDSLDAPVTAQPERWCRAARRWVSVTPIALDRNPGNLADGNPTRHRTAQRAAEEIIAASCTNIGLPVPARVSLNNDPLTAGSAPVRSFPRYAVKGGRLQRVLVHAEITFAGPVAGPVLLGAGRYLGYGLCAPRPSQAEDGGNA